MKCRFPVGHVGDFTIAVLLCETLTEHVGLLLHPYDDDDAEDPFHEMYYVGWDFDADSKTYKHVRLAYLGSDWYNLRFRNETFRAEWRDIYISNNNHRDKMDKFISWAPDRARGKSRPFRVPRHLIRSLRSLHLIPITGAPKSEEYSDDSVEFTLVGFMNTHTTVGEGFFIRLGLCAKRSDELLHLPHWATVYVVNDDTPSQKMLTDKNFTIISHDCETDHVEIWPNWTRDFGNTTRTVRLSFTRCVHNPITTRVVQVELIGSAYDNLRERSRGNLLARFKAVADVRRREVEEADAEEADAEEADAEEAETEEADSVVEPPRGSQGSLHPLTGHSTHSINDHSSRSTIPLPLALPSETHTSSVEGRASDHTDDGRRGVFTAKVKSFARLLSPRRVSDFTKSQTRP